MRPSARPGGGGLSSLLLLFLSILASSYVVSRLWMGSREITQLRSEVERLREEGGGGRRGALEGGEGAATDSPALAVEADAVLFYSVRPRPPGAEDPPEPTGDKLEEHQPPAQLGDARRGGGWGETRGRRGGGGRVGGRGAGGRRVARAEGAMDVAMAGEDAEAHASGGARCAARVRVQGVAALGTLLGQVDAIEAGVVHGWACLRGSKTTSLSVVLFVDGVRVAEAVADQPTQSSIVHRLCEQDAAAGADGGGGAGAAAQAQPPHAGVRWRAQLPPLPEGRHEVRAGRGRLRAFALAPSAAYKHELNQSPLPFRESSIATLWEEVHTRQPWRNALGRRRPILPFPEGDEEGRKPGANSTLLAFFGINTGLEARARRDVLRRTWVPTGEGLKALEARRGIMIRFVVGYSEQKDDPMEKQIQEEMRLYGDVMRLDMVDTYADLSLKTLHLFGRISAKVPADFYFKIDDDVAVNVDALADYLEERRGQGNLYMGCMKSGEVLTDKRWKWYEPEHWRFGDPAGGDGKINYMRHASGQIYGLSRPVARFLGQNEAILHRYANEDVGMGAWLVGTDIQYDNQRRLCCDNRWKCAEQSNKENVCLAYYEHQCAGICASGELFGFSRQPHF
eukprot:scaffold9.g3159.t1